MTTSDLTQMFSYSDMTKIYGVSRRTIEREIQRRRFPQPVKIGGARRFLREDVELHLEKLKRERDGTTP